jgi:hypothetical protein
MSKVRIAMAVPDDCSTRTKELAHQLLDMLINDEADQYFESAHAALIVACAYYALCMEDTPIIVHHCDDLISRLVKANREALAKIKAAN